MTQSPYRRGADNGLWFGLYLSAMFLSMVFAPSFAPLATLALALMVCVPLVIYRFMSNYSRSLGETASFSMFWMQGVVIFFCGAMIASVVMIVYMKWINPDYITSQLQMLADLDIEAAGAAGAADSEFFRVASETAAKMLETNFVPSATSIMFEIIMLAIVSGSILSMVLGGIVMLRRRESLRKSSPDSLTN